MGGDSIIPAAVARPPQDPVAVIGLGRSGLAIARALSRGGVRVVGFDQDPGIASEVAAGRSPVGDVPDADLEAMFAAGFEVTGRDDRLHEAGAVLICVPTGTTAAWTPDLGAVNAAAVAIARRPRPGQLVVLTSPAFPGATRSVVCPALRSAKLPPGQDYAVAYAAAATATAGLNPWVVGGIDAASAERAAGLLSRIGGRVVRVSSPEAAELCGLIGEVSATVSSAFRHELNALCDRAGIDPREVLAAADASGPTLAPRFALGDNWPQPIAASYWVWAACRHGAAAPLVGLANEVVRAGPARVTRMVVDVLNATGTPVLGSRIALLGLAADPADGRPPWPGVELLRLLGAKGAVVTFHDPLVPDLVRAGEPFLLPSHPLTPAYLAAQDCVVFVARRPTSDPAWVVEHSRRVVDSCDATIGLLAGRERISRA